MQNTSPKRPRKCWEPGQKSKMTSTKYLPLLNNAVWENSSDFADISLDMMEPERPKVDRSVLEFAKSHKFHAADFVIRSDGVCRLNPVMAKRVAQVVADDRRC